MGFLSSQRKNNREEVPDAKTNQDQIQEIIRTGVNNNQEAINNQDQMQDNSSGINNQLQKETSNKQATAS